MLAGQEKLLKPVNPAALVKGAKRRRFKKDNSGRMKSKGKGVDLNLNASKHQKYQ